MLELLLCGVAVKSVAVSPKCWVSLVEENGRYVLRS